jgi:hypothetical protein
LIQQAGELLFVAILALCRASTARSDLIDGKTPLRRVRRGAAVRQKRFSYSLNEDVEKVLPHLASGKRLLQYRTMTNQ